MKAIRMTLPQSSTVNWVFCSTNGNRLLRRHKAVELRQISWQNNWWIVFALRIALALIQNAPQAARRQENRPPRRNHFCTLTHSLIPSFYAFLILLCLLLLLRLLCRPEERKKEHRVIMRDEQCICLQNSLWVEQGRRRLALFVCQPDQGRSIQMQTMWNIIDGD